MEQRDGENQCREALTQRRTHILYPISADAKFRWVYRHAVVKKKGHQRIDQVPTHGRVSQSRRRDLGEA